MKKLILPIVILAGLGAAVYFFVNRDGSEEKVEDIKVKVQKGKFEINVTATGELQAKRSEKIRAPKEMQPLGIWETTIAKIIPEGTLVGEGEYVATLDRSNIDSKLQDLQNEMEKTDAQLTQTKIDTAIELRGLRDQLVNLKFSMKDKDLELEQSKYEPPAVIQRVKLDLERVKRDYSQSQANYSLKQEQAEAKVAEIMSTLQQNQTKFKRLNELGSSFTIKAPKAGMLIYARQWRGKKGPGSRIAPWDNVVAELPDLTDMISKIYVNEVDINKIKLEQAVVMKVDAFPDMEYSGNVIKVANIGETLPNFDAKVFEVTVQVNEVDSILRPAMTTSNEIVTKVYEDVFFLPLECVHNDSVSYVFKELENGSVVKQEVVTGVFNSDEIIVRYGVTDKDIVLLNIPDKAADMALEPLPEADKIAYAEEKMKKVEEEKMRALQAAEKKKEIEDALKKGGIDVSSGGGGDNGTIVIF